MCLANETQCIPHTLISQWSHQGWNRKVERGCYKWRVLLVDYGTSYTFYKSAQPTMNAWKHCLSLWRSAFSIKPAFSFKLLGGCITFLFLHSLLNKCVCVCLCESDLSCVFSLVSTHLSYSCGVTSVVGLELDLNLTDR